MKIVQVVHGFPPYNLAGTEVYTYNLSKELAKRHRVFVFHRIKDAQRKEYEIIHRKDDGLDVYAINNTFKYCSSFEQTYRNEVIAKNFAKFLDNIQPDIVHIQHLLFLSTDIIEEIKKRNLPIVFTLHDYCLICPRGQLLKNDLTICDGPSVSNCADCLFLQINIRRRMLRLYKILYRKIPLVLTWILKKVYSHKAKKFLFKRRIANQINARAKHFEDLRNMIEIFIVPSMFLKNRFIEFGIPETKIVFSQYGFNLDLFKKVDRENMLSHSLRFAFLGTLLPSKGVHLLIKAFNKIKKGNVELKIYGKIITYKGFEGYLEYIKKLAQNKNIQFMGEYPNENVSRILAEIEVLVVPSIWYENSPLVIQEAILAKIAVIAAKIGGIPELIENGKNGLLFQPNNVDDLYVKMKQVIENRWLQEKFAQDQVNIKSIEKNAQEMEKIYTGLIRRAKY